MTDAAQKSPSLKMIKEFDTRLRTIAFQLIGRPIESSWSDGPGHPEDMRRTLGRMEGCVELLSTATVDSSKEKAVFWERLTALELDLESLYSKVLGRSDHQQMSKMRKTMERMQRLIVLLRTELTL